MNFNSQLKIKDEIDLARLKDFGLDEDGVSYYLSLYDACIEIKKSNRVILLSVSDWGLEGELGANLLTILFDLISAGFVEKVEAK